MNSNILNPTDHERTDTSDSAPVPCSETVKTPDSPLTLPYDEPGSTEIFREPGEDDQGGQIADAKGDGGLSGDTVAEFLADDAMEESDTSPEAAQAARTRVFHYLFTDVIPSSTLDALDSDGETPEESNDDGSDSPGDVADIASLLNSTAQSKIQSLLSDEPLDTREIQFLLDLSDSGLIDPNMSGVICDAVGLRLLAQSDWIEDESVLEVSIVLLRRALDRISPSSAHYLKALSDLPDALQKRYTRLGDVDALNEALSYQRKAVALCTPDNPYRAMMLDNLAGLLQKHFDRVGDATDLGECLTCCRDTLNLHPPGHPHRPVSLNNISNALRSRHGLFHETGDLEEALSYSREALELLEPEHPYWPMTLINLARTLQERYELLGQLGDLEEAILHYKEALISCLPADRASLFNDLAQALDMKYEKSGNINDLEEALPYRRESLILLPPGHPSRPMRLDSLARLLERRYDHRGGINDLEEALLWYKESLSLRPLGNPDRFTSLDNLACTLRRRYERLGEVTDVNESISYHREALTLLSAEPSKRLEKAFVLDHLAVGLQIRHKRIGDIADLEECISDYRDALAMLPPKHADIPIIIDHLAGGLQDRYKRLGEIDDLEEAISNYKKSLALVPQEDPDRPNCLNSLATALQRRYDRLGDIADLEEAKSHHLEALDLFSPTHPNRWMTLSNLAIALELIYRRLGGIDMLNEAILKHKEAFALCPKEHPERPWLLGGLSSALTARYALLKEVADLDEALSFYRQAIALLQPGHPDRSRSLGNFANVLMTKYELLEEEQDLHRAEVLQEVQDCVEEAIDDPLSSVKTRFQLSMHWAHQSSMNVRFRLAMYSRSLVLLQQLLIINPDINEQQSKLLSLPEIQQAACDAAADAIAMGAVDIAAIMLDQGRSLLLGTLYRYRSPATTLRMVDSQLAEELRSIGLQLEQLSTSGHGVLEQESIRREPFLDHMLNTQRKLLKQWEELLEKIRAIPSFGDFLAVPTYSRLQVAAQDGPVIILNASGRRCDAIIVSPGGPPSLVPLPDISYQTLGEHCLLLRRMRHNGDVTQERTALLTVLRSLWHSVVAPIVKHLKLLSIPKGSRLWWCPCSLFSALPIHAAGMYDGTRGSNLPDMYISSYISTISGLLRVKATAPQASGTPVVPSSLLYVGHSGGNLANIDTELASIRKVESLATTALLEKEATPAAVLDNLRKHHWLHFSCHGVVQHTRPLDSFFQLEGKPGQLSVRDIMNASLQNAEFAYLSACHSASAGILIPDENLHLAGALMFGGYHSIVGTMWEMYDEDGPAVAQDFYGKLMELGGRYKSAAEALSYAIRKCRKRGAGLERWVMFIHIGA